MTEDFLQFLWKFGYYKKDALVCSKGNKLEVVKAGELNTNAGPDFFNAQIRIDKTLWAGNVEIHINASDWNKHKHSNDTAYSNVILHVVLKNDISIKNAKGEEIPTLVLDYDPAFETRYAQLLRNEKWVACERFLPGINKFEIHFWLAKLAIERLSSKSDVILKTLLETNNNWEESFYIHIARSFGLKENTLAFEMLAKSLPLLILAKHKNQLFQIEALLFGQAGMLAETTQGDEKFESLKKEYKYLKQKYSLKPISYDLWKYLRLRPSNFPEVRIAEFASLIYQSSALFSKILEQSEVKNLQKLFQVSASEYWDNRYRFNTTARKMKKQLGVNTINSILINTIIPFIFVYGKQKGIEELTERAISYLENMKPENNSIVKRWANLGIESPNAFYSQAVIQLKNEYCKNQKCINCRIGNEIITLE